MPATLFIRSIIDDSIWHSALRTPPYGSTREKARIWCCAEARRLIDSLKSLLSGKTIEQRTKMTWYQAESVAQRRGLTQLHQVFTGEIRGAFELLAGEHQPA
jgi:hypothetical protein